LFELELIEMTAQYTLKVVSDFAAAHALRDYPGDCRRLHGHNWKVEVEVTASTLDDLGMVVDFKTIKTMTKEVTDQLDHQFLNEIAPFDVVNPTAENMAAYIYKQLNHKLDGSHASVSSVTLWETERACVRYSEETQ
jgi:6-pyruvoyltetrahydropterin/6-carboxytetrahydropterin synthase